MRTTLAFVLCLALSGCASALIALPVVAAGSAAIDYACDHCLPSGRK